MSKLVDTDLSDGDLAKTFANSGYWQDAKDANKAMVKILGGREIGVGPMTSMREINIIKGKIELSASLMARLVKESDKYDYRVTEHTTDKCVITFYQNGDEVGESSFTMDDAEEAGLVRKNSPWEKYPKNMLFARALSNGVKWHCPDVTGGSVYHKGEISNAPDISEVSPGDNGQPTDTAEEVVDAGNVQTEPVEDEGSSAGSEDSTDRPDWADEWLDRDLDAIKSAYDGGDVTAEEVASRERQLPEEEQRHEVLAWASYEVDKQQADELNEPQPLG